MFLSKEKKKIRYAVVGLGYIAQVAVLPAFKNARSNSILAALVSGDEEKLKKLGEKYKVDQLFLYSQFEECLRRGIIDAIYICTPNSYHRNIMETAAKYGVHVLCEKPMAVTVEDCLSMIQAANRNHIQLMIGYRLHFEAANIEVLKLVQSKRIGEAKIFHSTFTLQVKDLHNIRLSEVAKGGGPLYDIGIYCINAARNIFKSEPIEVFALAASSHDQRFKKTDESMSVVMKFPDERLATFSISFGAFSGSDFEIIGSKGTVRLEKAYNYSSPMRLKIYEEKKIITKKYSRRDQFGPELIYFSDCIIKKSQPEPSGEEGLADIKIIEAILLSIDLASPIRLDEITKKVTPTEKQKISRPLFPRPKLFHVTTPSGEKR